MLQPVFFLVFLVPLFYSCSPGQPSEQTNSLPSRILSSQPGIDPALDSFDIKYLTGKFDPACHPDFVEIHLMYADRTGMLLRKDAYNAFISMHKAALAEGVLLKIISATRNFERQKQIWEGKWTGATLVDHDVDLKKTIADPRERALRILRYSSMPGTSRHHWGTDIDLNRLENNWFSNGEGLKVYTWLTEHASEYGFCQPYSPKGDDRPNGYEEEKWHWSWLPVAQQLTTIAAKMLKDEDIQGFEGDYVAGEIGVVSQYVLGINPSCK